MEKERYSNAEIEIVRLESGDVIATSSEGTGYNPTKYVDKNGWD